MLSRVYLVAILLTLNCVGGRAMEHSKSPCEDERAVTSDEKVLRHTYHGVMVHTDHVTFDNPVSPANTSVAKDELTRMHNRAQKRSAHSQSEVEERDRPRDIDHDSPRPRKKRMDQRTLMALLMAYKLKFVALIPTLLGGLILLKGTTLLAGFFFALFAAVLGLKGH